MDTERLALELEQGHIVVVAGFQGRDIEGNLTTLGRGGSDTSAVALAAAVQADECQIYTDVDGVYTIDPRICPGARRLSQIPFGDMLELASVGAKVLHSRSVEYAGRHRVLLRVLSTFRPDAGTLMTYEEDPMQLPLISGIACQHGLTFLQLQALSHTDFCRLLNLLAAHNVETDMVQQYGVWPDQLTVQLVLTNSDWLQVADDVQNLLKNCRDAQHRIQANLAKLSVVGIGIRSQPDVVARIHQLLNQLNIQIWAMTQTESRFSVLMAPELVEGAAAKLHQVLFNSDN